jgi:hypothetical protein
VQEYVDFPLLDGVVVRWVRMARDFQPEDFTQVKNHRP